MKFTAVILGLASLASAHTTFTTLHINGKNQGDGTCVRMSHDDETATDPIYPVTGEDIACGRDGEDFVEYVCPANKSSTLTFTFRFWPSGSHPGAIDAGHLGPCAVYLKKVDDIIENLAAGPGWFKIWEDGFDKDTKEWCTSRLVKSEGLMSVELPAGLPSGYYLVRPEILALHFAHRGDPQYFVGCAQIFVNSDVEGPLEIPKEYTATIPGYVDYDTPGLTYDVYRDNQGPYPMPGPKVYIPSINKKAEMPKLVQTTGVIPENCVIKNANWCGKPIDSYTTEDACWAATNECYEQSKLCWGSAPPSGSKNCYSWSKYCGMMNDACEEGNFDGPPVFSFMEQFTPLPAEIPKPWNDVFKHARVKDGRDDLSDEDETTAVVAENTVTTEVTSEATSTSSTASATETPMRYFPIPTPPRRRQMG